MGLSRKKSFSPNESSTSGGAEIRTAVVTRPSPAGPQLLSPSSSSSSSHSSSSPPHRLSSSSATTTATATTGGTHPVPAATLSSSSTAIVSETHPPSLPLSHHHPYNQRPRNNHNPRHSHKSTSHQPQRQQSLPQPQSFPLSSSSCSQSRRTSDRQQRHHQLQQQYQHSQHYNHHPHTTQQALSGNTSSRRSQANISSARDIMSSTDSIPRHKSSPAEKMGSISLPMPSIPVMEDVTASPAALTKASTSFKFFKYFVFCYMLLVLGVEIGWAAYSTQGLKKDLQMYVEAGEWEQTYVREFFKSTKNFFMFNLILIFLSICIGLAAVGTENRHLMLAFLFVFSMEWFFEVIGVYNSKEKNVVIYRMIPALLRPGLIVSTLIFYRTVTKLQNLLADEIEKEEAGKPPSPPPAVHLMNPMKRQRHGYNNPVAMKQVQEEEASGERGPHATAVDVVVSDTEKEDQQHLPSDRETGNNNDSPTVTAGTTTTDENPENEDAEEEEEEVDTSSTSGRGSSTHEEKAHTNVIRISVE